MSFYMQWTQSIGESNSISKITVTKVRGQPVWLVLHDGNVHSLIAGESQKHTRKDQSEENARDEKVQHVFRVYR